MASLAGLFPKSGLPMMPDPATEPLTESPRVCYDRVRLDTSAPTLVAGSTRITSARDMRTTWSSRASGLRMPRMPQDRPPPMRSEWTHSRLATDLESTPWATMT